MNKYSNTLKKFSSFSFLRNNRPNFYLKIYGKSIPNLWQHCKSLSITSMAKFDFENVTKLFRLSSCQPMIIYNSIYYYLFFLLFSIISPWSTTTLCPEQHFDSQCIDCKVLGLIRNLTKFP